MVQAIRADAILLPGNQFMRVHAAEARAFCRKPGPAPVKRRLKRNRPPARLTTDHRL
jgi:hypothetical protein